MEVNLGVQTYIDNWRWQNFRDDCELEYPGNFWNCYANIFAPTRLLANILWREKGEELADAAFRYERKLVRIFWSLDEQDAPIPIRPKPKRVQTGDSIMAQTIQTPELIFASTGIYQFTRTLIDVMGRILESDRPMAMVRLRDQKQVFLNQKFADLLATPPDIATGRSMKLGWNPAHLEECNRRIRQEGRFEFTYDSALNPKTYGRQTAVIELIDDGVDQYRLNTNQGVELLEFPEHMKQLQQFDW
jgi:PAS domain-containing protein